MNSEWIKELLRERDLRQAKARRKRLYAKNCELRRMILSLEEKANDNYKAISRTNKLIKKLEV